MSDGQLHETSLAIGRLQASQEATATDVAALKERTESMDAKLDKLLAREQRTRLTLKHWGAILAMSGFGGGGIAHILRKVLE